jgi:hypothetical protein
LIAPDWDVIQAITTTLSQLLSSRVEYKWIKGHQDTTRPYNQLSFPAQLNCQADQLAAAFQNRHGNTQVLLLPGTHAHLLISGHAVTSRMKPPIRLAVSLPNLHKYLMKRFAWSDTTIADIDWETFSQLIHQQKCHHRIMVKHVHAIAPTGHIAHRNNPHHPRTCPSCPCDDETNDHMIQCPARSRQAWRSETHTTLLDKLHTYWPTDPHLQDILRDGSTRVHHSLPQIVPHDQYPDRFTPLIESQNNIGWINLYRGRWSVHWKTLHTDYAQRQNWSTDEKDGSRWVRKCGQLLLERWKILWKTRNMERHGADEHQRKLNLQQIVRSQVEEYYTLRDQVMQVDRTALFPYQTAHAHLSTNSHSLQNLQEWIMDHRPLTIASAAQAQQHRITGTQDIRAWLTPPATAIPGG